MLLQLPPPKKGRGLRVFHVRTSKTGRTELWRCGALPDSAGATLPVWIEKREKVCLPDRTKCSSGVNLRHPQVSAGPQTRPAASKRSLLSAAQTGGATAVWAADATVALRNNRIGPKLSERPRRSRRRAQDCCACRSACYQGAEPSLQQPIRAFQDKEARKTFRLFSEPVRRLPHFLTRNAPRAAAAPR